MKKYQIIYADPPWKYWAGGKKNATKHYNCQDIEWIYDLPIRDIADENCALFLWATFPMLPECVETVKRWGFRYATTAFIWVKRNRNSYSWFWGCGNYTRANAEICLLGIKGKMDRKSKSVHQVVDSAIGVHSDKPDEIKKRIVDLFGDLPRIKPPIHRWHINIRLIELFSRKKTMFQDGWDVWGNEVESDIELLQPTTGKGEG